MSPAVSGEMRLAVDVPTILINNNLIDLIKKKLKLSTVLSHLAVQKTRLASVGWKTSA